MYWWQHYGREEHCPLRPGVAFEWVYQPVSFRLCQHIPRIFFLLIAFTSFLILAFPIEWMKHCGTLPRRVYQGKLFVGTRLANISNKSKGCGFCMHMFIHLHAHSHGLSFSCSSHVCFFSEGSRISLWGPWLHQSISWGHSWGQGVCQAVSWASCQTESQSTAATAAATGKLYLLQSLRMYKCCIQVWGVGISDWLVRRWAGFYRPCEMQRIKQISNIHCRLNS